MTAPDGPSDQQVALQGALMTSILADLAHGEQGVSATSRALLSIAMPSTVQVAWTLHGFALAVAVPIRQAVLNGSIRDYPFYDLERGVEVPPGADPQVWDVANTLVAHAANGRKADLHAAITSIVNSQQPGDGGVDGTYFCNIAVTLVVIASMLLRAGCEWPDPTPELQDRLWAEAQA